MRGRRVDRVLARRPDLRYPLGSDFVARLEGQTVREVRRRAKYLLVDLSSGDTLVIHLGMSGSFRTIRSGPADHLRQGYGGPPKRSREGGSPPTTVVSLRNPIARALRTSRAGRL